MHMRMRRARAPDTYSPGVLLDMLCIRACEQLELLATLSMPSSALRPTHQHPDQAANDCESKDKSYITHGIYGRPLKGLAKPCPDTC